MGANKLVAVAQARLDEARRRLKESALDFSVSDEAVLDLRREFRRAFDELKELDRKATKKGIFGFLGF